MIENDAKLIKMKREREFALIERNKNRHSHRLTTDPTVVFKTGYRQTDRQTHKQTDRQNTYLPFDRLYTFSLENRFGFQLTRTSFRRQI